MTASKGIRKSTKWKTVATQQSQHTLDALHQGDAYKQSAETWKTTATVNRRLALIFLAIAVAEAILLLAVGLGR